MERPTTRTDANRSTGIQQQPAKKRGRKSKYTPEVVARIVEAIQHGATYELAAAYAGIGHTVFHEWMNQKPEFVDAVKNAEGAGAMTWLQMIERAAGDGDWHAAAWKLERRYPQQYGRQVQQQQHSGEINHAIRITYVNDWRAATYQQPDAEIETAPVVEAIEAASNSNSNSSSTNEEM